MSADDPPDELTEFVAMLNRGHADAARPLPPASPEDVAAARRRRRRRRITALVVALVVVAAVGGYVPLVLLTPVGATAATVNRADIARPAATALALPQAAASAVSIVGGSDFESITGEKEIVASSGKTGSLPIASISKLITALVVLEAKPLGPTDAGPTLTFSKADADLYDKYYLMQATVTSMKTGSRMSEHDALEVMLVVSASNYAEAVSTWAFGSQARYLNATRAWLAKNGLGGTRLVEPTGNDPRNVSTPTDLIAIGKIALANPVIASIVQMRHLDIPSFNDTLSNNNMLLGIDGVDGIKTGTLDEAGACLLFSAAVDVSGLSTLTVIGVVLGGSDHDTVNTAVRALIASIKSGFHQVPLTAKGQAFGSYSTPWKSHARIVAGKSSSVLSWSDTPITSTVVTIAVGAGRDGSKVGSVTFVAGKKTVTVPLVLVGTLKGPDDWWRITHPGEVLG